MTRPSCITCGSAETADKNFVLTCSGPCKRSWHSKCYQPSIPDVVVLRMLEAANKKPPDHKNSYRAWECNKCSRRRKNAEAGKGPSTSRSSSITATPTGLPSVSNLTTSTPALASTSNLISAITPSAPILATKSRPLLSSASQPIDLTSLESPTETSRFSANASNATHAISSSPRTEASSSHPPPPPSPADTSSFRPYSRPTQLSNNASSSFTPVPPPSAAPPAIAPPITQLTPVNPILRPPRNPLRHAARKTRAFAPLRSSSPDAAFNRMHVDFNPEEAEVDSPWLPTFDGRAQAATSSSTSQASPSSTKDQRASSYSHPDSGPGSQPPQASRLPNHNPPSPSRSPSPPPPPPPPPPPSHYKFNPDQTVDIYDLTRHLRAEGKLDLKNHPTFTVRTPTPEIEPAPFQNGETIHRKSQRGDSDEDEDEVGGELTNNAADEDIVDSDEDLYASVPPTSRANNTSVVNPASDTEDIKEDDDEVDGVLDLSDDDSDIVAISRSKPNRNLTPKPQGRPKGGDCWAKIVRLRTGRHLGAYDLAKTFHNYAIISTQEEKAVDKYTDPAEDPNVPEPMDTREGEISVDSHRSRRRPRKAPARQVREVCPQRFQYVRILHCQETEANLEKKRKRVELSRRDK